MHIFAPKNVYKYNNALVFVSFGVSFGADLFAAGKQAEIIGKIACNTLGFCAAGAVKCWSRGARRTKTRGFLPGGTAEK
jgi:hypothetical protein